MSNYRDHLPEARRVWADRCAWCLDHKTEEADHVLPKKEAIRQLVEKYTAMNLENEWSACESPAVQVKRSQPMDVYNDARNIVPSCGTCNRRKGARFAAIDALDSTEIFSNRADVRIDARRFRRTLRIADAGASGGLDRLAWDLASIVGLHSGQPRWTDMGRDVDDEVIYPGYSAFFKSEVRSWLDRSESTICEELFPNRYWNGTSASPR